VSGLDAVRVVVHWIHAIAAVAWVGGSIFYLVVLRPALAGAALADRALETAINKGFREMVDVSIIALVLTGVFITLDRLSSAPASSLYLIALGLKLTTVITMFLMARQLGTRTGRLLRRPAPAGPAGTPPAPLGPPTPAPPPQSWLRRWLAPPRLVLVLGLVAFFLSMVLGRIYEHGLAGVAAGSLS
jgi:uncharacterized membrane protein